MDYLDVILETMKTKKISAALVERENNLSQSTISNWKRGATPSIDNIIKVIKYLGLSADELFGIKQDTKDISNEILNDKIKRLEYDLEESRRESFMRSRRLDDIRFVFRDIKKYSEWIEKMINSDREDRDLCLKEYNQCISQSSKKGEDIAEEAMKTYKMSDYID